MAGEVRGGFWVVYTVSGFEFARFQWRVDSWFFVRLGKVRFELALGFVQIFRV